MHIYDVYFAPDAFRDLEDIYKYIADGSGFPERAWAYMEKLRSRCRELETCPQRGRQRNDLMSGLRIYPLDKKAVAAFVVDEERHLVCILNIFYGGRNYEALFGSQADKL